MKPLIGLTSGVLREAEREWMRTPRNYSEAIQRAGGIPVLLPFIETDAQAAEIVERIDGLLLTGGGDMDSFYYGEQPHPHQGEITPERDITELALLRAAMQRDLPTFGICRGHQLMAVAAGGTLYQDAPSQLPKVLKHDQEAPRWYASHMVSIRSGTLLSALLGTEARVNSFHHQAVKTVPSGWVFSAEAPDGVNEALEHPGYRFMLSVQWHPEDFTGHSTNFDSLFDAFVAACRA